MRGFDIGRERTHELGGAGTCAPPEPSFSSERLW
jgi:hypothetical protein